MITKHQANRTSTWETSETSDPTGQDLPPAPQAADERAGPIRRASIAAGVGLLLMGALALIGNFLAVERLVTPGNAAQTATDIIASEGLFRLGIASLALVVVLDVVVAWALYRVFQPVDAGLSMLAAAFRFVYAGVFLVAISRLKSAMDLLDADGPVGGLGTAQVHALALRDVDMFGDVWSTGLLLFGVHLLIVGYLAYRWEFAPRALGVLLTIAGFGYLFDSLAVVLIGDGAPMISTFTFLGEVLLALWLLIRGRRLPPIGPVPAGDR